MTILQTSQKLFEGTAEKRKTAGNKIQKSLNTLCVCHTRAYIHSSKLEIKRKKDNKERPSLDLTFQLHSIR